jgi:hypothetical protein
MYEPYTYTSKGMINDLNLPRKEPEWESPAAGMRPYICSTDIARERE